MKGNDVTQGKKQRPFIHLFSRSSFDDNNLSLTPNELISSLRAFLDTMILPALNEQPPDFDPWFFDYYAQQREPVGRKRFACALAANLALAGVNLHGRIVVDAGSGFGVQLLCFGHLGAKEAIGLEMFGPMVETATRLVSRYAPLLPAHFLQASVSAIPLREESVDFVFCNEALSHFIDPAAFLRETVRILRPGGRLLICDGNNAANSAIVRRTHRIWRAFEEGPPTENMFGHFIKYSYRGRRREKIAARWPGLDESVLERLSWGTFGLHGSAIIKHVEEMLASGLLPESPPPVDRAPVDPDKGDFIENFIHPNSLRSDLQRLGFEVRVYAHFGGSRSPLISAANKLLRAFSPVTIARARAFKIVAIKK
jgi:SAM-dependent methyltransferase